jgi:hypothetical protein
MTTLHKFKREEAKEYHKTSKGAIYIGIPGVGKTTIVRHPRMVSASILAMEFQAGGLEAVKGLINPQLEYNNNTVIIDDLGLEEDVKHFGNGLDPIAYVVQHLYDTNQQYPDHPIKLFFTTNFDQTHLTEKYGVRTVERIWELCDRVFIDDVNLRKS